MYSCQYSGNGVTRCVPTRRSSDLGSSSRTPPPLVNAGAGTPGPSAYHGREGDQEASSSSVVGLRVVWWMTAMPRRSEEHTSELQSRENRVCRLLLEEKNKR